MMKKNNLLKIFISAFVFIFIFPAGARAETEPILVAKSAVVIDARTGVVIYGKNIHEKLYPASITKLMTVLLALEYADGVYEERVEFSYDAVYSLPYDSSNIAMDSGESLSFEHALYAIMLASANEVANAVAEHIAGSMDEFAALMTERAAELGAVNTKFANPHGLHDDGHYTTAYDMALIMRECIKHPFFLTLISTEYYEIPPTEKQSEIRGMTNSNRMIRQGDYFHPDVIGGKTGFTTPAGHTLVTYAERGGTEIITAVMKSEKNVMYTDTAKLIEYGFGMYGDVTVLDKNASTIKPSLPVTQLYKGKVLDLGSVKIIPSDSLVCYLPANIDMDCVDQNVTLPESLEAPVKKGQAVGKVTLSVNGYTLGAVAIMAQSEMPPLDTLQLDYEEKSANSKEPALKIFSALNTIMFFFSY